MRPRLPSVRFAFAFLLLTGPAVGAERPLVIAVQPTATPEQLTSQGEELEAFLEQQLGRDVELKFPTSYAGVVESLRFGHADAAFMSAWPAQLAVEHGAGDVALAEVREVTIGQDRQEAPYYYSYWIVRPDSPFQRLEDLRGKRAAFPSPLSTSGYIAPMARLAELDLVQRGTGAIEPQQFFGQVAFSGGYAQAWEALKQGQVDVTVIAGDVPEALYRDVMAAARVIEQQGPIPSHAVVISRTLSASARDQLVAALMALNDEAHRPLMRKFVSGIFVRFEPTSSERHLGALRAMLERTGAEFAEAGTR